MREAKEEGRGEVATTGVVLDDAPEKTEELEVHSADDEDPGLESTLPRQSSSVGPAVVNSPSKPLLSLLLKQSFAAVSKGEMLQPIPPVMLS